MKKLIAITMTSAALITSTFASNNSEEPQVWEQYYEDPASGFSWVPAITLIDSQGRDRTCFTHSIMQQLAWSEDPVMRSTPLSNVEILINPVTNTLLQWRIKQNNQ